MSALGEVFTLHAQALLRALSQMRTHPGSTALSALVIGIAIMLPLGLHVLFTNLAAAAGRLNADPTINVYFNVAASADEARAIEARVRGLSNVAAVTFIDRDAALTDLKRAGQLNELLVAVDGNPLPHALVVRPRSLEPPAMQATRQEISAMARVETVTMEFEWARKLLQFAHFLERMSALLGLLLAVAVAFVTGNTIRLQILTRRDEIVVARLIGATRRFVRRPFLYFGAIQGAIAGVLAVGFVAALAVWGGGEIRMLAANYGSVFAVQLPEFGVMLAAVSISSLLGWLGAALSVAQYWRDE